MNEIEFIENIDASFPYDDENKWRKLIKKGAQISDNASFMVLYEICCAPKEASKLEKLRMMDEWVDTYSHPLKDEMVMVGKRIIENKPLTYEQAIELMERISQYNNLYNALNLILFACDDKGKQVNTIYNSIINKWRQV